MLEGGALEVEVTVDSSKVNIFMCLEEGNFLTPPQKSDGNMIIQK